MSWRICSLGGALFAMLFGAGNIIFPLILGRALESSTPFAMIGFCLTAVGIPMIGYISVMLAQGDYGIFLGKLGRIPGLILGLLCMTLLGPLGATPRCIAIAHADLSWYLPNLSSWLFSLLAACVIWICTFRKNNVMNLIARFLAPTKIICLLSIVVFGLLDYKTPKLSTVSPTASFWEGFTGGYSTMDLLAIIFFSHMIFQSMGKDPKNQSIVRDAFAISIVAGILLTLVYVGFAGIAAMHGPHLVGIADDMLLSGLASLLLGPIAGLFANITIVLTCLTTAIALTASFADFLSRYVFRDRLSYRTAVTFTVISSALLANLKLAGIMQLIMPVISLIYPFLTIFSCLHLLVGLWKWERPQG
ncbi:MAG: branched-chain amino acid transport system II carrier protein [Oligoflexales bacterium]|nr:branched-chain amino acid transport system II carrier protein [Oligoflexales bacterium]